MKIKLYAVLASATLAFIPGLSTAHATNTTIGFAFGDRGPYSGSTIENGYIYTTAVGSVYLDIFGNPGYDMEGNNRASGGVLDVKTVGAPSLFSFVQVDALPYALRTDLMPSETLIVYGYLNGNYVGADVYTMSTETAFNWTTKTASNLAGQNVDELQFSLPGYSDTMQAAFVGIDNIVLHQDDVVVTPPTGSTVPEPSSFALLGTGALGIAGAVRRKLLCA